jgi:hypothetical protein
MKKIKEWLDKRQDELFKNWEKAKRAEAIERIDP